MFNLFSSASDLAIVCETCTKDVDSTLLREGVLEPRPDPFRQKNAACRCARWSCRDEETKRVRKMTEQDRLRRAI